MFRTTSVLALWLLMMPPLLAGQIAARQNPADGPRTHPAGTARSSSASRQPLQLTIIFKRERDDKLILFRTYTLAVTPGEILPVIRDDARFRTDAADDKQFVDSNTDIDILRLRRQGSSVFLALRVSTQSIGRDVPDGFPKLPIPNLHQYLVTPTVPLGKITTVYSASDDIHHTSAEVQLLVKPATEVSAASQ